MRHIISRYQGESDNEEYPPVEYVYNGKGYTFNGEVISEYDLIFKTLTEKEIEITVILLNDVVPAYPQLIHPQARSGIGTAPYYAFNGADEEGVEYLAAIGSFLAERYSGRANGRGIVSELSAYFIIRLKVSMAPAGYLFPWIRDGTAIPIA